MAERLSSLTRVPENIRSISRIEGEEVRALMRLHRVTIRQLAEAMQIPMTRVREVRANGVEGYAYVHDYIEAILKNSREKKPSAESTNDREGD